jgi:hypothetical protein
MNRSTNSITHTICRDGVYYYHRRVPNDLSSYYSGPKLCFSLRTRSRKAAERAATSVTSRLDDYWMGIRLQKLDIPVLAVVNEAAKPRVHIPYPPNTRFCMTLKMDYRVILRPRATVSQTVSHKLKVDVESEMLKPCNCIHCLCDGACVRR